MNTNQRFFSRSFTTNNSILFVPDLVVNQTNDIILDLQKMYEGYFDEMRFNYLSKIVFLRRCRSIELRAAMKLIESLQSSKSTVMIAMNSYNDEGFELNERISYIDRRVYEVDQKIDECNRLICSYNAEILSLVYYPLLICIFKWIQSHPSKKFTFDTILTHLYFSGHVNIPKRFSFFKGDYMKLSLSRLRTEISFHPILMEIERRYISFYPTTTMSKITAIVCEQIEKKRNSQQATFYLLCFRHWKQSKNNSLDDAHTRFLGQEDMVIYMLHFLSPFLTRNMVNETLTN